MMAKIITINILIGGGDILSSSLNIGELAPDFTLPATTKHELSLSEYRGKMNIVVAFYGMDFTPG
ncbi:redoxin domain-containing protein [Bacillus sp. B15-48]|nr:redoxin domain-containing protein [Bacillus sp. B15-48]